MKTRVRTYSKQEKNNSSVQEIGSYIMGLVIIPIFSFVVIIGALIFLFEALSKLSSFISGESFLIIYTLSLCSLLTVLLVNYYLSQGSFSQIGYRKRRRYMKMKKEWDKLIKDPHFHNHHNYLKIQKKQSPQKNLRIFTSLWAILLLIAFLDSMSEQLLLIALPLLIFCIPLLLSLRFQEDLSEKKMYAKSVISKKLITIGSNKIFFH